MLKGLIGLYSWVMVWKIHIKIIKRTRNMGEVQEIPGVNFQVLSPSTVAQVHSATMWQYLQSVAAREAHWSLGSRVFVGALSTQAAAFFSERLFQGLRAHLLGTGQGPVLKTGLSWEWAGFEQLWVNTFLHSKLTVQRLAFFFWPTCLPSHSFSRYSRFLWSH